MHKPRWLYAYVGVVGAGAVVLIGALHLRAGLPALELGSIFVLASGVALVIAAGYCPICIGRNVAVNMASTVMFAMALLLPPAYAAAGAAAGMALLYVFMRWPALYVVFNAGQSALTVGGAGLILSLGVSAGSKGIGAAEAAAIVAAAGAFFLINSVVVTTFAVLHGGMRFSTHWKRSFGQAIVPYMSTLLLGVVVAVTYMHAPIMAPILILPTIAIYRSLRDAIVLRRQTRETVEFLADIMDKRDPNTYAHSQRVADLARGIAARLHLPEDEQEAIAQAARVHDLGKLGIPDGILFKPERLSAAEVEEIRKHTVIGSEIVGKLPQYTQGKEFILFHHERYDGSGSFRLHGEHIPLGARIIGAADAYDAMTSNRPYRPALKVEDALAEVGRGKGAQFDPAVADALISVIRGASLRPQVESPEHAEPAAAISTTPATIA